MSLVSRASPDKITTNELNCIALKCKELHRITWKCTMLDYCKVCKILESIAEKIVASGSKRLNYVGLCCPVLDYVALCCPVLPSVVLQ